MKPSDRSAAIAAAIILIVAGLVLYFMPTMMLALGDISPFLAVAFGAAAVGAFFLVFWVRGKYRERKTD